jgi:hypothetical protein
MRVIHRIANATRLCRCELDRAAGDPQIAVGPVKLLLSCFDNAETCPDE